MSASLAGRAALEVWPLVRRYGPALLLIAATFALGSAGQSVARPLFIVGCLAVSWDLMRFGAPTHFTGCFLLFCLAPLLRRIVDVAAGYEAQGLMISGPLLALMVPAPRVLADLASGRPLDPALRPFLLACACVLYATILTICNGDLTQAASNGLKWLAPTLYGMWIFGQARRGGALLDAPTAMAMLLMPALGLYGFLQYVDPPIWDRFWMTYTTIASIGQPEPFMVRVFSTLNAPAGYATFTASALLLFGFRKANIALLLAAAPCVLGLMLSMYRTAWIGLAAGIVLGLFHPSARRRAAILLLATPLLGAAVVAFSPAGDALQERLQTLGSVGDDASGQERLGQYAMLMNADDGTLIGHGFGTTDVLQAGAQGIDGQFIVAWFTMGLVVGMLCVAAVAWAGLVGMRNAWRSNTLDGLAVTGILTGLLVQLPLAAISSSETGFLFWSMAGIGAALRPPPPR